MTWLVGTSWTGHWHILQLANGSKPPSAMKWRRCYFPYHSIQYDLWESSEIWPWGKAVLHREGKHGSGADLAAERRQSLCRLEESIPMRPEGVGSGNFVLVGQACEWRVTSCNIYWYVYTIVTTVRDSAHMISKSRISPFLSLKARRNRFSDNTSWTCESLRDETNLQEENTCSIWDQRLLRVSSPEFHFGFRKVLAPLVIFTCSWPQSLMKFSAGGTPVMACTSRQRDFVPASCT